LMANRKTDSELNGRLVMLLLPLFLLPMFLLPPAAQSFSACHVLVIAVRGLGKLSTSKVYVAVLVA
jgi:hypothetical protein